MRRAASCCLLLAAASLIVSGTPSFDAWGWALWGRELTGHGVFSTAGYPSWKPLPALVDSGWAAISVGGVPTLWLVTARAAGLLALVLAARLASRFGGRAAGLIAAVGLAVSPQWWILLGAGASEPMEVALVLGAIERHLDRHHRQALALALLAALLRPEVWPFLLLYALLLAREAGPWARVAGAAALASVPLLWFGGDWLGSGSPWTGSQLAQLALSARELGAGPVRPAAALVATGRAVGLVAPPLLVGVAWAVFGPQGAHRRTLRVLAAGAAALIAFVAVQAALGYAGLGRFSLVAGAVLCVVGAVGLVAVARRLAAAFTAPASRPRTASLGIAVVLALAAVPAAVGTVRDLHAVEASGDIAADTRAVLAQLERSGELAACRNHVAGPPASQPALAVALARPIVTVHSLTHAGLVIGPAGSWPWKGARRWLRDHPAHRRVGVLGPERDDVLVYEACGHGGPRPSRQERRAGQPRVRPARLPSS